MIFIIIYHYQHHDHQVYRWSFSCRDHTVVGQNNVSETVFIGIKI